MALLNVRALIFFDALEHWGQKVTYSNRISVVYLALTLPANAHLPPRAISHGVVFSENSRVSSGGLAPLF